MIANAKDIEAHNEAFIDGQNLKVSTFRAKPSWNIDLKRFRCSLRKNIK